MPNGGHQRQEDEEELIKSVENDGWNYYPDPPDWVLENARSDGIDKSAGFDAPQKRYHGDNYVYLAVSSVHGRDIHVFSQKKSEYHETTPEEGVCPNCQAYVQRYDEDDYLTCHRCGWQYKPLKERLRNLIR
ncbi:hypothetical protein [Halogeometricum borinquense]|uniref:hypothetical protein n=1 Tax=Halogeometricum borinquense TaxID=60847 RepID=UPI0034389FA9